MSRSLYGFVSDRPPTAELPVPSYYRAEVVVGEADWRNEDGDRCLRRLRLEQLCGIAEAHGFYCHAGDRPRRTALLTRQSAERVEMDEALERLTRNLVGQRFVVERRTILAAIEDVT